MTPTGKTNAPLQNMQSYGAKLIRKAVQLLTALLGAYTLMRGLFVAYWGFSNGLPYQALIALFAAFFGATIACAVILWLNPQSKKKRA
jgi:hypothetical protein